MIYELQKGIRLPAPDNCPTPISLMIQACFKEEPNERPSFSELKATISESHKSLKRGNIIEASNGAGNYLEVRHTDTQMVERYLMMKRENHNLHIRNKVRLDTPDLSIKSANCSNDAKSMEDSFANDVGSYLSLQNMISGGFNKPSSEHRNECPQISEPDVIRRGFLNPDRTNNARSMTPGFPRNSSFSAGEDLAPLLQEQKHLTKLTPSKSYPNPDYILNLADHESFTLPENSTQKSL